MGAIERACKVIKVGRVLRCSRDMRDILRAAREDDEVGCVSVQNAGDNVVLTDGTWDFFSVPGTNQPTVDFNDLTSSFSCSPL